MNEFRVSCVTRSQSDGRSYEHITHIGGIGATPWRLTKDSAIRRIEGKQEAFYTIDNTTGRKVYIGVVYELNKAPFLRTYSDGKWNDNLVAQPECPSGSNVIS